MKSIQTEGIIISARPYQEADQILKIFTRDQGTIFAIARGMQKSQKRFQGKLLFQHLQIELRQKTAGRFYTVISTEIIRPFPDLTEHLDKLGLALFLFDVIQVLDPADDATIFDSAVDFLVQIESQPDSRWIAIQILYFFIQASGYAPSLIPCDCPTKASLFFDLADGRLNCQACYRANPACVPISKNALQILGELGNSDATGDITPITFAELFEILNRFVEYHTSQTLKTEKFLRQVL